MDTRAPTSPENPYSDDFKPAPSEVQRSSVASTSGDITSSTIMSTQRAVVDNAKIFPLFAKRLASHNVKEYTTTANKLKTWLSSEKAYYPDALRNIVSLLEIAHLTFETEFMKTQSSALAVVDIYQALIRAVVPFLHRFKEDLQFRLQHLIQNTSEVMNSFARPMQAEGEAILQERKNALSIVTSNRDTTPSTQLTFPIAQVQSPTTMRTFSTSLPHPDTPVDPPASVTSPTTTFSKPQPKRLPRGSSLPEYVKNRDLEWFKMQQLASSMVDPPQPGVLESIHEVAGPPAAEKLRPSRMPGRIPSRLPPSEPVTSPELTAPPNAVDQSSTSPSSGALPTNVNEDITSVVADIAMNDPRLESVHPESQAPFPSHVPESTVPEVPNPDIAASSPKPSTDLPASTSLHSTTSDDVGVESRVGDSLPSPVDDAPLQAASPRFGGNMAVMTFQQGLQSPRGLLKINFNLDDTRYSQITRWAKRRSSPTNLEDSVCVSFACYHLPGLLPSPPEDGELPPFETLTMRTPCSWPTTADLSLQTKRDGKDFVIPLAPPIFLTPDDCIDISAFIRNGENAFSVVQQSDMSEYIFMLHAHHPTPAQLSHLASCRHEREEWARSIRALCKPEPTESLWKRSSSPAT